MPRLARASRVALLAALLALPAAPARAADLAWSALGGFQGGGALRLAATVDHVVKVPLAFELGLGHAWVDPGDPAAARRVFINNATNGTPEKSGGVWDLRVDAVWWLKVDGLADVGVTGGVRYSMFSGRFTYVGGDEDFTVASNAWGFGVGARAALPIDKRWSLTGSVGLDWFPEQTITGHDASYSSNGQTVNARGTYGWRDADKAINQPWLVPSLLVGVTWRP